MKSPKNAGSRPLGRPKSFHRDQPPAIKSLDRAMEVLGTLARLETATLTELSKEAGEAAATVYRILATLEAHGMVAVDEDRQAWHVGAGAFRIGTVFLRRTGLVERSRPALRRLMEESGETANLGILSEGQVLFVSQVETHAPIRAFFPPGTRSDLHASGIGKVLLAHLSPARVNALLAAPLPRYTDRTVVEPERLRDQLEQIRRDGWAIDDEERNTGMRCIAAPIRDLHGEVRAGLSVSGPSNRVAPGDYHRLAELVRTAAREVSAGLGADQP